MLLGGAEKAAVGHHDRAGGIICEAHVQQGAGTGIGWTRVVAHPLEQRCQLEERELIGKAESAVLRAQQRGDHERPPLRVVMLAEIVEQLGRNHLRLDAIGFLQSPAEGLRDRKRVAERIAESLAALFQLGIMIALRLDVVAHPGFGRDQRARIAGGLFLWRSGRAPLKLAERGVETHHPLGDSRCVVGQLDQFGSPDPQVGKHRIGEDFAELVGAGRIAAFGRERLHVHVEGLGQPQQDSGGDRPLVALEMVQVGSGDSDLVGHGGLVEAPIAPKPPQSCPQEQLPLCDHRQIVN